MEPQHNPGLRYAHDVIRCANCDKQMTIAMEFIQGQRTFNSREHLVDCPHCQSPNKVSLGAAATITKVPPDNAAMLPP